MRVAATSYVLIKAAHAAEQALGKTPAAKDEPWHPLIGVRNRLAHDYRHIDSDLLWKTATDRVAEIRVAAVSASTASK